MSLRDHMEGVKDCLSSETMQNAFRRLMEEALREGILDVYRQITWSDKDDDRGMSFIGLHQWTFTLLCCFGECHQRTHVSNPQKAGKYVAWDTTACFGDPSEDPRSNPSIGLSKDS